MRSPLPVALLIFTLLAAELASAQTPSNFPNFAALRRYHAESALRATAAYLTDHPDAPDAPAAYEFLFDTALAEDLTREASPQAEAFLNGRPQASAAEKSKARRVVMLGLALDGQAGPALDLFDAELAAVRRIDPSAAIDAATDLAAAVQRGGKPEAAAEVYGRLKRGFFLNPAVDEIAANRLARLELLGEPMPAVGLADLDGGSLVPGDLAGKVVLVDFWATNCVPCLEELPELQRLHADHHEAGFEIFAVDLDEEESNVRAFLSRSPVPWRIFLSAAHADATRKSFRVETIPANFLIAPDGTVARVDLHGHGLRAEVERLLREKQDR